MGLYTDNINAASTSTRKEGYPYSIDSLARLITNVWPIYVTAAHIGKILNDHWRYVMGESASCRFDGSLSRRWPSSAQLSRLSSLLYLEFTDSYTDYGKVYDDHGQVVSPPDA